VETSELIPHCVYPPLAAVDLAVQRCLAVHDGFAESLLLPCEPSDRAIVAKLQYYESILSLSSLEDLLVPALRHLAVAIALSSRLFLSYPIPTHNLQRLISLMAERVLAKAWTMTRSQRAPCPRR
jgi:hypothetical protein